MQRLDQDRPRKVSTSPEEARRQEEWGEAFCFVLNRRRLEQEGFQLRSEQKPAPAPQDRPTA